MSCKYIVFVFIICGCAMRHVFEWVNALTMVFPFAAWWKHRGNKRERGIVHRLLVFHIPASMMFHALNSALPASPWTFCFRALDYFFIHATALGVGHDLGQGRAAWVSSYPLHVASWWGSLWVRDTPVARFGLLVWNSTPLLGRPEKRLEYLAVGLACYGAFYVSYAWPIGHGIFHVLLYKVYDAHFKEAEERRRKFERCVSHPLAEWLLLSE